MQEQIWAHKLAKTGDPELLLALMFSRIVSDVTVEELLHMPGNRLIATTAALVQSIDDVLTGKVLIAKMGLQ